MQYVKKVAEYFTPVLSSTQYLEKGVLTPEEFVAAGDQLCYKCPAWSWARSSDPSKSQPFLPPEKQYLITRNVPSVRRKADLLAAVKREVMVEDEWINTEMEESEPAQSSSDGGEGTPSMPDIQKLSLQKPTAEDDVPDMSDFSDANNMIESDPATLDTTYIVRTEPDDSNIVHTRTYDVTITYDKYYQVPRIWLFGYDEQRQPLTPDQVFEDVSQDHARKTVTFETHPHLGISAASIHPCKHSNAMKNMIDTMIDNDLTPNVEQSMFLFLKFISCLIPTVQYDFTMEVSTSSSN